MNIKMRTKLEETSFWPKPTKNFKLMPISISSACRKNCLEVEHRIKFRLKLHTIKINVKKIREKTPKKFCPH